MKGRLFLAGLSLLTLSAISACNSTDANTVEPHASPNSTLANSWVLTDIDGQPVSNDGIHAAPTLNLDQDLTANGHTSCNRFFGQAMINEGQLMVKEMGFTMMACPEPHMRLEQLINTVLSTWSHYRLSPTTLTLSSAQHVLVFSVVEK